MIHKLRQGELPEIFKRDISFAGSKPVKQKSEEDAIRQKIARAAHQCRLDQFRR